MYLKIFKYAIPGPGLFTVKMPRGAKVCIGCGCGDYSPCEGGCSWVAVDVEAGVGICSSCATKSIDQLLARLGVTL